MLLASGLGTLTGIAADQSYVYWSVAASPPLQRTLIGGGAISVVSKVPFPARAIALDGTEIYWMSDSSLWHSPKASGPDITVLSGQVGASAIVTDDSTVYWGLQNGKVMSAAKVEVPTPILLASGTDVRGLTQSKTDLYFADFGAGMVGRVAKAGGAVEAIATGQGGPRGIVVDAGKLYWTNNTSGQVMSFDLSSKTILELAFGQGEPFGIGVDGQHVYWTNRAGGQVMKVAR
jgi:hypothetical protein